MLEKTVKYCVMHLSTVSSFQASSRSSVPDCLPDTIPLLNWTLGFNTMHVICVSNLASVYFVTNSTIPSNLVTRFSGLDDMAKGPVVN